MNTFARLINISAAALTGAVLFMSTGTGNAHAAAKLVARVDISEQRMEVLVDGIKAGEYVVSTGKKGYRTPLGDYKPTRMHKKYYSRKYHNSPMPNSIFFNGGIAVHGANSVPAHPASHGCVRIPMSIAEYFPTLVNTGDVITVYRS